MVEEEIQERCQQLRRGGYMLRVIIERGPIATDTLRDLLQESDHTIERHTFYRYLRALTDIGLVDYDRDANIISVATVATDD